MDYESAFEMIQENEKRICLGLYKSKSDAELQAILAHNALAVYSQDAPEIYKTLGESQACSELLKQRRELEIYRDAEDQKLGNALSHWEDDISARRKKAILNLPAATSYHGQLVAAILEEEKYLSAKDIRQWSDALTSMDDDEYQQLLSALIDEGIIFIANDDLIDEDIDCSVDDDLYSLLTLCTPDLFPTDPMLWITLHNQNSFIRMFFQRLVQTGKPATERDWIALTGTSFDKKELEENPKSSYKKAKQRMSTYVNNGILSMVSIPGTDLNYYYFAMLGEKEGK